MKPRIRDLLICAGLLIVLGRMGYADGFIVVPGKTRPVSYNPFPLEVKYHHVLFEITDRTATTTIDQLFYNSTDIALEGEYIFPIPRAAAIKKFSMYINGQEVEAELLDATKASSIYEQIVRQSRDPALLEYEAMDIFKARIFPIEPFSEKRVKITYDEILKKENGTVEYLYPLNTEKFSSQPLEAVSVVVSLKTQSPLKNIYSTTHEVDVVRKSATTASVSYEEQFVKPDRDFKLYYGTDSSDFGLSLLTYREAPGEAGYFFMDISPDSGLVQQNLIAKDITFVIDVSGSMKGAKIREAKEALNFCVENLNPGDRFEIIRFSTEAEALFGQLTKTDGKTLDEARAYIQNLGSIGGTNIEDALTLALKSSTATDLRDGRPHTIVFLTDGKPTIGETDEDKLTAKIAAANIQSTRIFTFGIGYDINTHLLDTLTRLTRAYRTYIAPDENIESAIANFYTLVRSPVLTDLVIKATPPIKLIKTYPKLGGLPDLFAGVSLSLIGRYTGSGDAAIILEGKVNNRREHFTYQVSFPSRKTHHDSIPSLWAARRIGYLLDQIRLNGHDQELVDEITELARTHGIITPYTSYLIVEDEERRVIHEELESKYQTLGNISADMQDFKEASRLEYDKMQEKTGKDGVQASEEVQSLNRAFNHRQTKQGLSRLKLTDASGRELELERRLKNVQGRAFYNDGTYWVDSQVQRMKKAKIRAIAFGGQEYFDLLKEVPQVSRFLALGQKVLFAHGGVIYEVH